MRSCSLFCCCVVLVLCFPSQLKAQGGVTVSGTVHDAQTGETLPYAGVLLDGTGRGVAANVDGYFVIVGLVPGAYVLQVSYLGYLTATLEIDTASLNGPLHIVLQPITADLDEVLVTAEQYQIMQTAKAVSQVTLSPSDLAVLPNLGEVDLFRALQLLPGISGTNEGSAGLYVRGGTPDQNLVLLDGMNVYHVDHFFGFFSAFNADAIKDVQIYKGGYPAAYGGRTSSVVDLTGRTGGHDYGLGVGLNLLSASTVAEVPLGSRGSFLLSARRSYTDVIQTGLYSSIYETLTGDDLTPAAPAAGFGGGGRGPGGALGAGFQAPGQAIIQPDFYFYDLNAKINYRPTSRDVVALTFYNGQDNLDESRFQATTVGQGGAAGANIVTDIFDVTGWGNLGVSGKWSRQWSPRLYSNTLVAYARYFSENEREALFERYAPDGDTPLVSRTNGRLEDNQVADLTIRLDNTWQAAASHKVGFGLQATRSNVDYDFTRNDTLTILSRQQAAQQLALYAQDTWQPTTRLRLTGGLRTAYYDATTALYLEPRASFRFDLNDRVQFKGAIGEYHQFVARVVNEDVTEGARDFWLLADGDEVGVQGATHYVLGTAYETPAWLFDVEAYYKDLRGLSEFSLRFQRNNVALAASDLFFGGTGTARGLELLVQKKAGRHTGWLSYTLAEIAHTFPALNGGNPFPALHDQTHELKLVNSRRLGSRWTASATWALATGKPYTAPESQYTVTLLDGTEQSYIHVGTKNGERLPAYHRMDAALHYRFPVGASKVDLGVSVFNLYNRTNVWYKEFDLTASPFTTTDVTFLGITPNLSVRVDL